MVNTTTIDPADRYFDLRLIAPFFRQSRMPGPKVLCDSNQSCAFCDDLPKKNAASNKNGTVGNRGRKTPANPANTLRTPIVNQTIRIAQANNCRRTAFNNGRPFIVVLILPASRETKPPDSISSTLADSRS